MPDGIILARSRQIRIQARSNPSLQVAQRILLGLVRSPYGLVPLKSIGPPKLWCANPAPEYSSRAKHSYQRGDFRLLCQPIFAESSAYVKCKRTIDWEAPICEKAKSPWAVPSMHECREVQNCGIYRPSRNAAHLAIRLPHEKHFRDRKVFLPCSIALPARRTSQPKEWIPAFRLVRLSLTRNAGFVIMGGTVIPQERRDHLTTSHKRDALRPSRPAWRIGGV